LHQGSTTKGHIPIMQNRINLNEPELGAVIAGLVVLSAQMQANPQIVVSVRDILGQNGHCLPLSHVEIRDLAQRLDTGV